MHNSKLSDLIQEIKISNDFSRINEVAAILKQTSISDDWLSTVYNSENSTLVTHEINGKEFIPIFTEPHFFQAKGNNILTISFNKIIKPLLQDPKLGGIEINPFIQGLCIETGDLLNMILGQNKHIDVEKIEWQSGIPNYTEDDIYDKQSLLDFALEIFEGYCGKNGIDLMFGTNDTNAVPNVLIRKDGKLAFVLVDIAVAPEMPKLSFEKRTMLFERSKHFEFECYYAPIGIGSSDPKRFEKSLALRGDTFYINFEGLIKVEDAFN